MSYKFETIQLHGGQYPDSETGSRAVPIYQTSSYVFKSSDHAANLFSLKENGNIYTRLGNPTTQVLEERISLLEGGIGALGVASGAAAVAYTFLTIAKCGDEILSANNIYGGTYNFLTNTIIDYGIHTKFFNPKDLNQLENLITSKTKIIFIESLGNPSGDVVDIEKICSIAHKHNIPVVVDNTFATPYLIKPFEFGADIVVYSATKFLGGHGTSIAGLIVDSGNFNWKDSKFETFNTPDNGYHGLKYSDLNEKAFITKARVKTLRDTGAALSPFNSFLILQGIETLSLRMERHVANAEKIAEFLFKNNEVEWISYPKFQENIETELVEKYLKKGATSIFTFGLKGGRKRGKKFIDSLQLFSHLANVADAKSLIIHPASTTHGQLNDSELESCGIKPETIRISIGLENIYDLIEDLKNAIEITK